MAREVSERERKMSDGRPETEKIGGDDESI